MAKPLSLEEFRRDPDAVRARLHASGEPQILLVEGGPDLIIQEATKYEAMLDELEEKRFVESVQAAMREMDAGGGITLEELEAQFEADGL